MKVHETRSGRDFGWYEASQDRMLQIFRGLTTGRNEGLEERVFAIFVLEEVGHHVGDVVDAEARKSTLCQDGHGLGEIRAAIFEIGDWPPHDVDQLLEQIGYGCTTFITTR